VKPRLREFVVVHAKLPAKERRDSEPVVVESIDPQRTEQKQRDRRVKALAVQAFRNWRPG
jgi:hypothetical protein